MVYAHNLSYVMNPTQAKFHTTNIKGAYPLHVDETLWSCQISSINIILEKCLCDGLQQTLISKCKYNMSSRYHSGGFQLPFFFLACVTHTILQK